MTRFTLLRSGPTLIASALLAACAATDPRPVAAPDLAGGTAASGPAVAVTPAAAGPARPALLPVYAEALALSERLLPDPAWMRTPAFADFRRRLAAPPAETAEALAAHFNRAAAAAGIGFSHYVLVPPAAPGNARGNAPANTAANAPIQPSAEPPAPQLSQPRSGVALLRIPSFSIEAGVMAQALQPLMAKPPATLILDLRGNSGGSFPSAAVLLGFLAKTPVDSGLFLARPWFAAGKAYPDPAAIAALPPLQRLDLQAFAEQLQRTGAARLILPASPRAFAGRVLVLIDGETASASEPVAWLLRTAIGATLIGERTAGAMLSSELLPLSGGYRLRLPVADYLTAEAVRLEGRGVEPDVAVPAAEALDLALARAGG